MRRARRCRRSALLLMLGVSVSTWKLGEAWWTPGPGVSWQVCYAWLVLSCLSRSCLSLVLEQVIGLLAISMFLFNNFQYFDGELPLAVTAFLYSTSTRSGPQVFLRSQAHEPVLGYRRYSQYYIQLAVCSAVPDTEAWISSTLILYITYTCMRKRNLHSPIHFHSIAPEFEKNTEEILNSRSS